MRLDRLIRRKLVELLGERAGGSAAEFAVLAPILFLAVIGIIELAVLLTVQILLEGSVREASRFGITGYTPSGVTRDQQIRSVIAQYTVGMVNMNNLTIDTRYYHNSTFAAIVRPEPCFKYISVGVCDTSDPHNWVDVNGNGHWDDGNGTAGSGGSGDIVLYTIYYRHHIMTPLMQRLIGYGGYVSLEASLVVRNEPW
jgi:Flp pilus assembly protein TadG